MSGAARKTITVRDGGGKIELFPRETASGMLLYAPSPEKTAELRERYRKMRGCPPRTATLRKG